MYDIYKEREKETDRLVCVCVCLLVCIALNCESNLSFSKYITWKTIMH